MVQYFEHLHAPMQIVHLGVFYKQKTIKRSKNWAYSSQGIQGIINTNIRTLKALHSNRKQNNPNPVAERR